MILIKQMHQRSAKYVIIDIIKKLVLNYRYYKYYKYEPYLCNGCHDLMQKAMSFNDVAIVSIKGNDYRIHFCYMSEDDAINIMKSSS